MPVPFEVCSKHALAGSARLRSVSNVRFWEDTSFPVLRVFQTCACGEHTSSPVLRVFQAHACGRRRALARSKWYDNWCRTPSVRSEEHEGTEAIRLKWLTRKKCNAEKGFCWRHVRVRVPIASRSARGARRAYTPSGDVVSKGGCR